jgi:hypothetical protein
MAGARNEANIVDLKNMSRAIVTRPRHSRLTQIPLVIRGFILPQKIGLKKNMARISSLSDAFVAKMSLFMLEISGVAKDCGS